MVEISHEEKELRKIKTSILPKPSSTLSNLSPSAIEEISKEQNTPKTSASNLSISTSFRKNIFRGNAKQNSQEKKNFFLTNFQQIQRSYSNLNTKLSIDIENIHKISLRCSENLSILNTNLLFILSIKFLQDHFIEKYFSGELMEKPLSIIFSRLFVIRTCLKSGIIDSTFVKNYVQDTYPLLKTCTFIDLFRYFIDSMAEESEENLEIFEKLFVGKIERVISCLNCDYKKSSIEKFFDLSLEVSQSIERSLEILNREGRIMSYCVKCEDTSNCTQRITIVEQPNILIMHFKRFLESPYLHKNNTFVKISKKIEINDSQYELINVVVHQGDDISDGKYEIFCKYKKKWYAYIEKKHEKVEIEEVLEQHAYALIYRKK